VFSESIILANGEMFVFIWNFLLFMYLWYLRWYCFNCIFPFFVRLLLKIRFSKST